MSKELTDKDVIKAMMDMAASRIYHPDLFVGKSIREAQFMSGNNVACTNIMQAGRAIMSQIAEQEKEQA